MKGDNVKRYMYIANMNGYAKSDVRSGAAIDLFEQSCDISFDLFQGRQLLSCPRENRQSYRSGQGRAGQSKRFAKEPLDVVSVMRFPMSPR